MTADIFLKRHRIEAVTTNEASLDVATGEDRTPDIRLSPNSASLRLGGGDGDFSDGDVRLMDRPDDGESEPRIHLTGGRGSTHDGTRVRVNGDQGFVKLGVPSVENPDVELLSDDAELRLGGGGDGAASGEANLYDGVDNLRVNVDARESAVRLFGYGDLEGETVRIEGSAGDLEDTNAGAIGLSDVHGTETVSVQSARNDVFGSAVSLRSRSGTETITLEANPLHASSTADGGKIALSTVGDDSRETAALEANRASARGGALSLSTRAGRETVSLRAKPHNHDGGAIDLSTETQAKTVSIESNPPDHEGGMITVRRPGSGPRVSMGASAGSDGGSGATLADESGLPTVALDGGDGRITLGRTEAPDPTRAPRAENGTLSLDDGAGMVVDLEAESGAVTLGHRDAGAGEIGLELRPEDGVFSVVDGDGDPVFRIDTQAKSIEKGKKYKRGVINEGSNSGGGNGNGPP